MHRRTSKTIAAATLAVAIPFTTAPTASAETPSAQSGQLCLFQYSNYNQFGGVEQCFNFGRANVKASLDNRTSSLWNYTTFTMCVYTLDNQKGYKLRVPHGHYYKNLAYDKAPDGRSWNDRISSVGPC